MLPADAYQSTKRALIDHIAGVGDAILARKPELFADPEREPGGGGLFSTIVDYARFSQMPQRLLSEFLVSPRCGRHSISRFILLALRSAAVRVITDLLRVVGIESYDHDAPLGRLLQDVLALPIFDGGNMGIRRRQLHDFHAA